MRFLILLPVALSFSRTPEAATPTSRPAAGDVIRVDFQPAGSPPPMRMERETYLADVGLAEAHAAKSPDGVFVALAVHLGALVLASAPEAAVKELAEKAAALPLTWALA